ncbi:hypothetical protein JCM10212_001306 [Sporobolomyces blumeae]
MSLYPDPDVLAQGPKELSNPGLVILVAQTPNGNKPVEYLEELKRSGQISDYTWIPVSLKANEQKSQWFEAINPNGTRSCIPILRRIPALLDNREGKKPLRVFESGAILTYLAQTYDKKFEFHFENPDLETEMNSWIHFQMGGHGPMQGQANHFFRYAPEKIPYGIERYQNETKRLFGVYEQQLAGAQDGGKKQDYLVGNKFSVADMMAHGWARACGWAGIDIKEFPHLEAWVERIDARPAVQAALKVPEQDMVTKIKADPSLEEKMAKASASWVQQGNEALKKK